MRLAAGLMAGMMMAAAPASAAWHQASTKHFLVYSDDDPDKLRGFATKLERFDTAIRVLRGVPDAPVSPSARVMVFVVPDVSAVEKLVGQRNVAGYYVPRASQSVAFVPRASRSSDLSALTVLLHEYTHHFTYATWGGTALPAWLVEGLAEYHAAADFEDDGSIVLGGVAKGRVYGLLASNVLPMKQLLVTRTSGLTPEQTGVFYSRSWILTHYLSADEGRRARLGRYVTALNAGKPAAQAIAELGDPDTLDRDLNAYIQKRRITSFTVAAKAVPVPDVDVRPLSAGEAAVMPARIRSTNGVSPKTAPAVAQQARRLAAPFPDDPGAQNVLAEAEYDAGDYAAAQAAAARALAADPRSVHAMMYAGLARMGALAKAKDRSADRWKEARGWFVRANKAETEYAWPLQLFYQSFPAAGQAPTANAQAGLIYAHRLAPFDAGLGMTSAYVLLKQDKPAEAAAVLKPVAYNPHGGPIAQAAGNLLTLIDSGGAKVALAVMEKGPVAAASSD